MVEHSQKAADLNVFNADRWVSQMQALGENPDKLDMEIFVAMLYETTNLFKKMGSAMSQAFSDVTSKAVIIMENKEFFEKKFGEKYTTLQEVMDRELELGVQNLNGENNHDLLKKDKKGTWEWKYTSTVRTVLRNLWLLDFIFHLMRKIYSEREATLSNCAKEAYNKGLGPHHPWAIRQVAKIAMFAVPSRDHFIHECKLSYEHVKGILDGLELFRENLWKYYRDKKLEKLP